MLVRAVLMQCNDNKDFVHHSLCKPSALELAFAQTSPSISKKELERFRLEDTPLEKEQILLIVQYLWKNNILQDHLESRYSARPDKETILKNLHASLVAFLDVPNHEIHEMLSCAPGSYWIYRPSVHDPARFIRGLLTVTANAVPGSLLVNEKYRDSGSGGIWEHGFQEIYEGVMVQKSGYPLLLTALMHPRNDERPEPRRTIRDRGSYRITSIVRVLPHEDGRLVSMTGLACVIYGTGGLNSTPVSFERIADNVEVNQDHLQLLREEELPESVKNRLKQAWPKHGLVRC